MREEQADTFTLGVVMDFLDDWTLTVDYYTIEIEDMTPLIGPDTIYETCLSVEKNPTADLTVPACTQIIRNPADGEATNIDLGFTNQGRAKVSGVDLQLNWSRMLANGGFNVNMVAKWAAIRTRFRFRSRLHAPHRSEPGGLGQGGNSVYEPLGRRGFLSPMMSF